MPPIPPRAAHPVRGAACDFQCQLPSKTPSAQPQASAPRRRRVVGLDIQPGLVAAVQARVNGSIVVESAAAMPLAPDTLRDGEVARRGGRSPTRCASCSPTAGSASAFASASPTSGPCCARSSCPRSPTRKELAAAVSFQAQDQVPMPLNNAVLDFHPLGVVDTPAGPRQRVVLVAAQRDMVERLLARGARRRADAEGVDLSAFALIRSLYRRRPRGQRAGRVLYLNVDGLTNLAIAEGPLCRFTRVVGGGLEAMAAELAAKREITVQQARVLLLGARLGESEPADDGCPRRTPATPGRLARGRGEAEATERRRAAPRAAGEPPEGAELPDAGEPDRPAEGPPSLARTSRHTAEYESDRTTGFEPTTTPTTPEADVWGVLENGIRDIYGEVRNSLDFHRSQEGGGEVSHVVLSGSAQDIPGFAEALQSAARGRGTPREVAPRPTATWRACSAHRLAVAAGLSVLEAAAMRAVNLIPADQPQRRQRRRRPLQGGAYAVLGIGRRARPARVRSTASPATRPDRKAQAAKLSAEAQQAQASAGALAPYTA